METEVTRKRFTVDEYHEMAKAGILQPRERVELIDGEIIQMSPIGYRHGVCIDRMHTLFVKKFGEQAVVSSQNPIRLNKWTEPQPDLVVFKPRADFYAKKRKRPEDVLFVVEVADSTLRYDQKIKLPQYAIAGIPEYWIADLKNDVLHVYRDPAGESYNTVDALHPSEFVCPLAFPDVRFQIDDVLSTDCEQE
jgi:hypothetical protein